MAQITAAMVKQLREMTDSPMMECKKALVEADGDMDAAVDVLRKNGLAKAAKKAGRETNEGAVAAFVSEDGKTGALLLRAHRDDSHHGREHEDLSFRRPQGRERRPRFLHPHGW